MSYCFLHTYLYCNIRGWVICYYLYKIKFKMFHSLFLYLILFFLLFLIILKEDPSISMVIYNSNVVKSFTTAVSTFSRSLWLVLLLAQSQQHIDYDRFLTNEKMCWKLSIKNNHQVKGGELFHLNCRGYILKNCLPFFLNFYHSFLFRICYKMESDV